jgi:hypothetical protein
MSMLAGQFISGSIIFGHMIRVTRLLVRSRLCLSSFRLLMLLTFTSLTHQTKLRHLIPLSDETGPENSDPDTPESDHGMDSG